MSSQKVNGGNSRVCYRQITQKKGNVSARQNAITAVRSMGYCGLPEERRRGEGFRNGMARVRQFTVASVNR